MQDDVGGGDGVVAGGVANDERSRSKSRKVAIVQRLLIAGGDDVPRDDGPRIGSETRVVASRGAVEREVQSDERNLEDGEIRFYNSNC